MPTQNSVQQMLDDLTNQNDSDDDCDFTDWERKFINSINRQVAKAGDDTTVLTGKQVDVVDKLWNKYCKSGGMR